MLFQMIHPDNVSFRACAHSNRQEVVGGLSEVLLPPPKWIPRRVVQKKLHSFLAFIRLINIHKNTERKKGHIN